MTPELRRITEDEYPGFIRNLELTYGFDYNPDEDTLRPLFELERSFGHVDSGGVVSTISAFSLEMSVPGGVVPCGGTTVVAVLPTHRRRGLLTEMMQRHFTDIREREEPIAGLWASESEIYGRFGYGSATRSAEITVHRRGHRFHRNAPEPAPVRMIEVDEAAKLVPGFHDRFRLSQPGMYRRSEAWSEHRVFKDLPGRRAGYTAARWAVVGDGDIDGYVKYWVKSMPGDDGHSGSEMMITDLFASTPEAWSGLWRYLLNHDLIARFVARLRSEEDPIFDLLAGPRRAQASVSDGLWIRVMDVPAALEGRSYRSRFSGVLEIHDPLDIAGGTFRLEASPDGVECTPSSDQADIILDVEDLGAAYLGDPGFVRLARSGRVRGAAPVLAEADMAFGWEPRPWCPEIF